MDNTRKPIDRKYWDGKKNKTIRYYFYVQRGLVLLNEFRYVVMVVFVMYKFIGIDNLWLIPAMFFGFIPVLLVAGWVSVHHMEKVMEYLNVQYTTHFSRYNIELQEKQLNILNRIWKFLKKEAKPDIVISGEPLKPNIGKLLCVEEDDKSSRHPLLKKCRNCGKYWKSGNPIPICKTSFE